MAFEVTWQCDLCDKKTLVEGSDKKPLNWEIVTVECGGLKRTGVSCESCSDFYGIPKRGLKKYWNDVVRFIRSPKAKEVSE